MSRHWFAVLLLFWFGGSAAQPGAADTTTAPPMRNFLLPCKGSRQPLSAFNFSLAAAGEGHAEEPATPPAATPLEHEALPRTVAGVTLGMSRTQLDAALGHLACHVAKEGYQVCKGPEQIGEVRHIEMYLHHDRVISVSYEGAAAPNAWADLNGLIGRYGRPSLNGMRERDQSGRLHEIYGWKDELSLYSVRFMWRDTEAGNPELVGTVIALWDRQGYHQWEEETRQPPPQGDAPKHEDPI